MIKPSRPPVVLTIAGLDPSGGAGILGDIKTISSFGCYGVGAVTSVTFQNTQQVSGALDQTAEAVRRQIAPLFDDFDISAVKTGMLPSAEIIREVAAMIEANAMPLLVVDPVLRSTSGFDLIDERSIAALSSILFPLATLVTPNIDEAQRLTGLNIRDRHEMGRAAEMLLRMGARAALITGGDANGELSTDLLLDEQGAVIYNADRIRSRHTHGTGCALASAIVCLLARGRPLRESIGIAKRYINACILSAPGLGHGKGPLDHFPAGFEIEN